MVAIDSETPTSAPAPASQSEAPSLLGRPRPSYELTRFVLLRLLGLVYAAAYFSLATQVLPLLGEHGLTPAASWLGRMVEATSRWRAFLGAPSLFFLHISDPMLLGLSWLGFGLSLVVVCGYANALLMFVLWALYLSFVHIGQIWYGYGWELLLCESGFLAIFLCPLLDGRPFPRRPTPEPVIWLYRWLALRVMLGAGLIKLRGDPCWRDLTCLDSHFETQPLPNPLSPLFHFMPAWVHKAGVIVNHINELVMPLGVFGPRPLRHIAGLSMILFQGILIFSGNLSFLNWLTIVPLLACLDDGLLGRLVPRRLSAWAERARQRAVPSRAGRLVVFTVTGLVCLLSISPLVNLFSREQTMNGAFDALYLVNTYGAFGSVGRERNEIVFEGTADPIPNESATWLPYELKCKPGDPRRRPCVVSPLQLRLDWQIWFAAMSDFESEPWTLSLAYKLLHGDRPTLSLLAGNPFQERPPRWLRAVTYRYRFAPLGDPAWWRRERIGLFMPPVAANNEKLHELLIEMGWLAPAK